MSHRRRRPTNLKKPSATNRNLIEVQMDRTDMGISFAIRLSNLRATWRTSEFEAFQALRDFHDGHATPNSDVSASFITDLP